MGLVTAVLGGIGFLATEGDGLADPGLRRAAAGAVAFLFLLGILTLFRMVHRNRVSNGYLDALGAIRVRLGQDASYMSVLHRSERTVLRGGLTHHVALVNCGLAALGVWLATGAWAWAGFAVAAAVQGLVLRWLQERGKPRAAP